MHLATKFLQLVAKRRPYDFFNFEPCHDYTDRIDKVDESHRNVVCQTDLTIEDFEAMAEELQTLKAKLNSKFKQEKKADNSKKKDVKW